MIVDSLEEGNRWRRPGSCRDRIDQTDFQNSLIRRPKPENEEKAGINQV